MIYIFYIDKVKILFLLNFGKFFAVFQGTFLVILFVCLQQFYTSHFRSVNPIQPKLNYLQGQFSINSEAKDKETHKYRQSYSRHVHLI